MADESKTPTHTIRRGRVRCHVWRNRDAKNGVWYSVTFARIYKENGAERTAQSFGRDDLLVLAEVAREAWQIVAMNTQSDEG